MQFKFHSAAKILAMAFGLGTANFAVTAHDHAVSTADSEEHETIFLEEFNEGRLDREKWNVVGVDFWVNNEQQVYIDSEDTIQFRSDVEGADGGVLVLRPIFRPGIDPNPERQADFVSGRIHSKGKFDFTHGRAEARIKLPDAEGVWPAWWLLGNGKWPTTGEIDIMEYVGEKDWIGVALHGTNYSGETPFVNKHFFPAGTDATDWHIYSVEWTAETITFEVDGKLIYRATKPMVGFYGEWLFDTPQHLILNFAVGGIYPLKTNGITEPYVGVPRETVDKIKTGEIAMLVDWVRVYAPEVTSPDE